MDSTVLAEIIAQVAADEAFERRLASCADPAELAGVLTLTDGCTADWSRVLAEAAAVRDRPPLLHLDRAPPGQWLPVQIYGEGGTPRVEWLHFAFAPLDEPFFEQTMARVAAHPINLVLRCSTSLDALRAFAGHSQPDGLVFHLSRCGSTLVGQMLGALDRVTVVSEPPVLDQAIKLFLDGVIPARMVQGMAGALLRQRFAETTTRIVKLDSWHTLALPRIAELFPSAASLFLFRDPIEVLVSQTRRPGLHARRGGVALESFGLDGAEAIADRDYLAWVIASIARAGLEAEPTERLALCDYAELPQALETRILPHFGIEPDAAGRTALAAAARRNAKQPRAIFVPDAAAKQAAADAELRSRALAQGLPALYVELKRRAAA
ncbi:sulfotransferase [Qipengyuania sp. YG27]|uniref:Sulfotransferase n=1 Tax=Qipengyuania mesophila TaxID=2867246 RepID=A0ABS7JTN9_9SPHN|nr:sulfotransferase [Qipengyuania mesophila]MBX7501023.1 sulfotransferase [Qipengyuania mesophila]